MNEPEVIGRADVHPDDVLLYPTPGGVCRLKAPQLPMELREMLHYVLDACMNCEPGTGMEWSKAEDRLILSMKLSDWDRSLFSFWSEAEQIWLVMDAEFCTVKGD